MMAYNIIVLKRLEFKKRVEGSKCIFEFQNNSYLNFLQRKNKKAGSKRVVNSFYKYKEFVSNLLP